MCCGERMQVSLSVDCLLLLSRGLSLHLIMTLLDCNYQVAAKNKTAKSIEWKVPGIMGGNNVPGWEDQQGSIIRRIVLWLFNTPIQHVDTRLPQKLTEEMPALLVKCNKAYHWAVEFVGARSIWDRGVLPTYFHTSKEEMAETVNSMRGFLASDMVVLDPTYYCPLGDMRTAWSKFVQERNLGKSRWGKDLYHGPLLAKHCSVVTESRRYPRYGTATKTKRQYVVGLDLATNIQDDENDENLDPNMQ